jgi:hypothetical protein
MNELDLRPSEIIALYWREQIVIEEDAELFDAIYLEAA